MTVVIEQPEVVFVEVWDATNVIAVTTPGSVIVEIIVPHAFIDTTAPPAATYGAGPYGSGTYGGI